MFEVLPKCLAIDYGTVRVGLAVSRASLADPLEIVANDELLFERLLEIISEEQIQKIVIGLSEQVMAQKTRAFAADLATHTSVPIVFTDETLSSKTVHEKMKTAKKSKRTGHIDHYAAAEFLQHWLDEQEAAV